MINIRLFVELGTFPVLLLLISLGTMHRGPVSPASPHLQLLNELKMEARTE